MKVKSDFYSALERKYSSARIPLAFESHPVVYRFRDLGHRKSLKPNPRQLFAWEKGFNTDINLQKREKDDIK